MASNEATNKRRNLFPIAKRVGNDKLQLQFYDIAQKARIIPNLPQPVDKTIEQVAEYLERLCVERTHEGQVWTGPRQATWVMDEITIVSPWEKWAGPAGLKRVYNTKFNPELDTYKCPEAVDPGYRCQKCRDSSSVIVDGHHRWCDCDGARRLKELSPDWIELLEESSVRSQRLQLNRSRYSDSRNIRKLLSRI
jgi:hypothetical protein